MQPIYRQKTCSKYPGSSMLSACSYTQQRTVNYYFFFLCPLFTLSVPAGLIKIYLLSCSLVYWARLFFFFFFARRVTFTDSLYTHKKAQRSALECNYTPFGCKPQSSIAMCTSHLSIDYLQEFQKRQLIVNSNLARLIRPFFACIGTTYTSMA